MWKQEPEWDKLFYKFKSLGECRQQMWKEREDQWLLVGLIWSGELQWDRLLMVL